MVTQEEIHRMAQSENVEERREAAYELFQNFAFLSDIVQAFGDIHLLAQDKDCDVRWYAVKALGAVFLQTPDKLKERAWGDLIRLAQDEDINVQINAAQAFGVAYPHIPEKNREMAWGDLIRLVQNKEIKIRWIAAQALSVAFPHIPEKGREMAWDELIRLAQNKDGIVQGIVIKALGTAFPHIPEKYREKAWDDLLKLTQNDYCNVRLTATHLVGVAFPHISGKQREMAWDDLHKLTQIEDIYVRKGTVEALSIAFPYIPDKSREMAWGDLIRLAQDENRYVQWGGEKAIGTVFPHIPDKCRDMAWRDLIRLVRNKDIKVQWIAAQALSVAFPYIPEAHREKAWEELIKLLLDKDGFVREGVEKALVLAFPHIFEVHRRKAWDVLYKLVRNKNSHIRAFAYNSMGRASIFTASEAKNEEVFKKELEKALEFFEKSSNEVTYLNHAKFCLPFYKSFHVITFRNKGTDAEVLKYLTEAKSAVAGSQTKEELIEIMENLSKALKEAKKARDFDELKRDLNAYRQYCDRAAELLETTEEKAPGATRLIRRGLPIIDERIKEIHERAKALCRWTIDTPFEEQGKEVNRIGQTLLKIRDLVGLEKGIRNMQNQLSIICSKLPEEERREACELLKTANEESCIEDKINLINMILNGISSQISIAKKFETFEKKLDELIISLKPGIREELTITVGAEFFGTGSQHVITIPLQEISYSYLNNDLEKIKGKTGLKFAALPARLTEKVKNYLMRNKNLLNAQNLIK